ncbi:PucR family transcriptional regulator [Saccharothrix algeriensis]|uniref:PucR family transcriptional regulator ligand-binding domain-containing protein n=1 Tax=Saccharothrix algeriensis TaxID=173560 RepID=A0A8T8HZ81_9PSEU|nr:PucR family transcriptional regulator ligand-binding domain-containing protein [Saccharothrix algeriensis]MBM7809582.1 purine catabolism regulator [Saccharothrix algeriensis]QTR03895.1 PucR family transcriptional regulator ligand-binding domain-containing protein [Saccharothrix algeriensis]
MYPTVAEALALPVVQRGEPRVVAGAAGLGRRVRWVHAAEIADIAHLLRGGELVLTTGIALPEDPEGLASYVADLAAVGAAGLVVELVRRWSEAVPGALVAAAERHGLPLVVLARETRFVSVTEAVVALIVDAQLAELRAAEQVHEAFTALTVAGAEPAEVLREVARTSGLPVVLETLGHDVLAYDAAGQDPTSLLADWGARSRAVTAPERTAYHGGAGWLVTVVGARGADWGRLVLLSPEPPPHRHVVVAERAASALAVHRLVARDRESLERQTHRTLLTQLLDRPPQDLPTRAAALGVPLERRQLVGVAIRPGAAAAPAQALATQEVLRDLAEATATATRRVTVPALVGVVDDTSVRALLSLPPAAGMDGVLRRLAREVHRTAAATPHPLPVVIAVGTTVSALPDVRRSLAEAAHVAGAALRSPGTRLYHRLDDVRLRGLLHLLREDERVRAFADRELGALVARDDGQGSRLVELLRHYCEHGGNKSAAAAAAHLSRTAYYQQLARIEQVLGVSLEDPESVLSLHVALLVRDMAGG